MMKFNQIIICRLLLLLSICLGSEKYTCAQESPAVREATEKGEVEFKFPPKPVYNYSLYDAVWSEPFFLEKLYKNAIHRYPKADLYKYPMARYKIDVDRIPWIKEGELLPDEVLDLPLWVVNDEYGRDTITLRTEMDKEWIVMEFWFESCSPCIKYMNRWESLVKEEGDKFNFIGVFTSLYPHRAAFEARKRGWGSPQVIAESMKILKAVFMRDIKVSGTTVWIKNGKFIGVSEGHLLKPDEDRMIITGELNDIPEHARWSFNQN